MPPAATLTLYFIHSPANAHATLYPPPESDADSRSTAVALYAPPAVPPKGTAPVGGGVPPDGGTVVPFVAASSRPKFTPMSVPSVARPLYRLPGTRWKSPVAALTNWLVNVPMSET